jgi:thiamine kinase-like enzyme
MCSETIERFYDYRHISLHTANRLFRKYDPYIRIENIELLKGGRRNTNYKLTFHDGTENILLRFYVDNEKGYLENALQKEYQKKIPMPKMYFIDEDSYKGQAYALTEYVNGISFTQYIQKYPSEAQVLFELIGQKLSILHQKTYLHTGSINAQLDVMDDLPPFISWYDGFLQHIPESRLNINSKLEIQKYLEKFHCIIEKISRRLVLSHGDFSTENILINHDDKLFIIDWENAISAPLYNDIGQLFRYGFGPDKIWWQCFLRGYNRFSVIKLDEDDYITCKVMDLANLLCLLMNDNYLPKYYDNIKCLIDKTLNMSFHL